MQNEIDLVVVEFFAVKLHLDIPLGVIGFANNQLLRPTKASKHVVSSKLGRSLTGIRLEQAEKLREAQDRAYREEYNELLHGPEVERDAYSDLVFEVAFLAMIAPTEPAHVRIALLAHGEQRLNLRFVGTCGEYAYFLSDLFYLFFSFFQKPISCFNGFIRHLLDLNEAVLP